MANEKSYWIIYNYWQKELVQFFGKSLLVSISRKELRSKYQSATACLIVWKLHIPNDFSLPQKRNGTMKNIVICFPRKPHIESKLRNSIFERKSYSICNCETCPFIWFEDMVMKIARMNKQSSVWRVVDSSR